MTKNTLQALPLFTNDFGREYYAGEVKKSEKRLMKSEANFKQRNNEQSCKSIICKKQQTL
ncbi:hypothetical protein HYU07_03285 [Candidatus Woesearchaeota archaeon]|nr:hypothetical protein [Candidatus Woesearchaeota archaeon]